MNISGKEREKVQELFQVINEILLNQEYGTLELKFQDGNLVFGNLQINKRLFDKKRNKKTA